jgi:signal transduction histidine kinase/Tfp pilus assembly protein PilF
MNTAIFYPIYLNCRVAIKLSFLLLLILAGVSCSKTDNSHKAEKSMQSHEKSVLGESLFKDIHKLVYENPSEARATAFRILDSLDKAGINDQVSRIRLLKHAGSSYVFETNYSEAIKYFNQALSIAEEIELYIEIGNINNNMGVISNEIGNYKTAYIHFVEALNNYDLAENQDKKTGTYNNIGLVYYHLKNYSKALSYFDRALDSTIQPQDTILLASVLNNIALCYSSLDEPDRALGFLDQAITLSEKINNKYGLCISHQLMGNIYLKLNQSKKAFDAFSVSIDIAREKEWSYQLAVSRLGKAKVLLGMNKAEDAFKVAFEVLEMAETQNSLVLKSDAHEALSEIFEKTGDYKNSMFQYREYTKTQEEIINQTVIHQVYDVELTHLNQLNKMQQLELERKKLIISKKNTLLFFISLVFIMLLIGSWLVYLNHRHRQKVKFQTAIIELTEKKSNASLEAEIQERKRIGEELHDSLGYLLSLAGLNASVLYKRKDISEEKRKELLEALMKSIEDAFDEVRNISHNLAPSLLSERGLKGALKNISDRVNQSTKLSMSFDTFGLDNNLDNLIENTLFRTIQEIVNNTIKHADASKLFIQIAQGNNEITLMAEDNGKGFNFDEIKKHSSYGLAHIKSRIENLNGNMFIDSNQDRGTIISILIPLQ